MLYLISHKDGKDDKIWHLYSCGGEGTILEHDPDHLRGEAKNVDQLIKTTNGIKVLYLQTTQKINLSLVYRSSIVNGTLTSH